jgi:hypothetical protein
MAPTPATASRHAVNDNMVQPAAPALEHPITRAAFDAGMAILSGRPGLIESIPLDRIVDGDPSLGDPEEILADLRAGRI